MIHHVYANRSNIGDWLSARGIQHLLGDVAITEHLCDEPFVPETLDRLAEATSDDLIVIGGGGLFMDYFTPFWGGFRPIADRVPFCIWGVGYCDLKQEPSRAPTPLLEEIVSRSRLCVVRDELTRAYLSNCTVHEPVSCPSLAVVTPPQVSGWGLLHVDNYTTVGAEIYEAMDAAGQAFARHTERPYRQTNNRIRSGSEADLAAILDRYAASDLVLSSALHGCVIGVAMGRKVLAVSGDRKIEAFMQTVGLGDWVLNQEEVDLLPQVLALLSEQVLDHALIEKAIKGNQQVAERVLAFRVIGA